LIRLLADENVPRGATSRLRAAGCDVAVAASGSSDESVLAHAAMEQRILVTLDRDFGRLALAHSSPLPGGVVYVRPRRIEPDSCAKLLLTLVADPAVVLEGRFTVISEGLVRQRPLRVTQ
jgi:predicted nuclease of predicted toxin-antitoxin system